MPSCGDYLVDLIIGYLDMDLAAFWAHKLQLEYIPNQIENRVALLKSNDKASVQPVCIVQSNCFILPPHPQQIISFTLH